jgi:tetratricopeptide (TPR) repeat protein
VSALVHGRFEVLVRPARRGPYELRDRATGRRALMAAPGHFLEDASSYAMASWVKSAARSDLAEVLALEPTVLAWDLDEGGPSAGERARLALVLLERCLDLAAEGITTEPTHASVVRRDDRWDVVVPAGLGEGGALHHDQRFAARWPAEQRLAQRCLVWSEPELDSTSSLGLSFAEGVERLAVKANAPVEEANAPVEEANAPVEEANAPVEEANAPVEEANASVEELVARIHRPRRAAFRRIDFERAEAWGELAMREPRQGWSRRYDAQPLAAVLHRKACLALRAGRANEALSTLDRVTELDPHARYLTTRALVLEELGHSEEARRAHEAAVAALGPVPTCDPELIRVILIDESVHDARTAHAYGAFLARAGELDAARPWLERGALADAALGPDAHRARRVAALAVVLLRLGERERAGSYADEALAIDPHEPSALAVRTRLTRDVSARGR